MSGSDLDGLVEDQEALTSAAKDGLDEGTGEQEMDTDNDGDGGGG